MYYGEDAVLRDEGDEQVCLSKVMATLQEICSFREHAQDIVRNMVAQVQCVPQLTQVCRLSALLQSVLILSSFLLRKVLCC